MHGARKLPAFVLGTHTPSRIQYKCVQCTLLQLLTHLSYLLVHA
jgi:hypothetical protein